MDHKVSVLVQIDLHGADVRLVVTGCLTESTQQVLPPLVARARALSPPVMVTVDLTCAAHLEASGVDLLRWSLEQDAGAGGTGSVELIVPPALPEHLSGWPEDILPLSTSSARWSGKSPPP